MLKQSAVALLLISSSPVMAISSSLDGVGPLNGIEWQVDIPWRMEPSLISKKIISSKLSNTKKPSMMPRVKTLISQHSTNKLTGKNKNNGINSYSLGSQVKIQEKKGVVSYSQQSKTIKTDILAANNIPELAIDRYYVETQYDPIPITFTIHDVKQQESGEKLSLNHFCGMYVIEFQPGKVEPETEVTFIPPSEFYEIEASKGYGIDKVYIEGSHQIRRIWDGESPNDLLNLSQWNEWHGTAYYTPVSGAPKGKDLRIIAAARVSMGSSCSDQYFSATDIVNKLRRNHQFHPAFEAVNAIVNELSTLKGTQKTYDYDLLKAHIEKLEDLDIEDFTALDTLNLMKWKYFDGWPYNFRILENAYKYFVEKNNPNSLGNLVLIGTQKLNQEDSLFFGDFLRTHYAADPFPNFGNEWVYGDLHYHSQGTDNDSESGTSYRSALASMKALGLDYTFATDHASDSTQLTGLKSYKVNSDGVKKHTPWYIPDFIIDYAVEKFNGLIGGVPIEQFEALRDMSPERFDHLLQWLQGENGGNEEVSLRPGSDRSPQIFLGGEVDVIPEASQSSAESGSYGYGDGLQYRWVSSACYGVPKLISDSFFSEDCFQQGLHVVYANGRVGLKDVQGPLITDFFARQHLLYLPYNVDLSRNNEDIFISSDSERYGGAIKHLDRVLANVEENDLGFVFLAHPVSAASGNGIGRMMGPDIYPYSKAQLEVAFSSPRVLGLQLWNENARFHSSDNRDNSNFPFLHGTRLLLDNGNIDWNQLDWRWEKRVPSQINTSLHHGSAMWDMVNLWGITPERTRAIGLPENTPRKFFMAGGSDAHGDMNYRREGAAFGWESANDTAQGTPRNLTFIGSDQNNTSDNHVITQNQVIDGLRSGRFSVTDGPAFRIAIDTNNNGEIDEQDILMGEDATLSEAQGISHSGILSQMTSSKINVIVEWKSTVEWGAVKKIDLMVGVQSESHQGLVYKPDNNCQLQGEKGIKDSEGREYCNGFSNIYVRDISGQLRFNVPEPNGFGGKYTFTIDAANYRLFDKTCHRETEIAFFRMASPVVNNDTVRIDDNGNVIVDPLPPMPPVKCLAENVVNPERMFIRAVASTIDKTNPPAVAGTDKPVERYAYSNPVWVRGLTSYNPKLILVGY